jgi:hypothetical protein
VPPALGSSARSALVIAHPGHELRVHHWLEVARPVVFILTDGSGHHGASRLATTTRILDRAGTRRGSIYGRLADSALYRALIAGDVGLFEDLASELADALVACDVDLLASDAIEGYNPGHDICRHLADAARLMAMARTRRMIAGYDFLLVGRPDADPPADGAWPVRLTLDDDALDRKVDAARSYGEIAADVDAAIHRYGRDAFRLECLRPMRPIDLPVASNTPPFYEAHGALRVEGGHYEDVIRFADHVRPVALALDGLALGARAAGVTP